jgi:hypothetical protein
MKPATHTLQLQGLDPTKLTVVQELPDVGKVVIQEQSRIHNDSITNILEEMKSEEIGGTYDRQIDCSAVVITKIHIF